MSQKIQIEVRRDGRLFRTLAGILGIEEPDVHEVVWPDDPRFYAADGESLEPDGYYEIPEDQPEQGMGRVIDEGVPPTVLLSIQIK